MTRVAAAAERHAAHRKRGVEDDVAVLEILHVHVQALAGLGELPVVQEVHGKER